MEFILGIGVLGFIIVIPTIIAIDGKLKKINDQNSEIIELLKRSKSS